MLLFELETKRYRRYREIPAKVSQVLRVNK